MATRLSRADTLAATGATARWRSQPRERLGAGSGRGGPRGSGNRSCPLPRPRPPVESAAADFSCSVPSSFLSTSGPHNPLYPPRSRPTVVPAGPGGFAGTGGHSALVIHGSHRRHCRLLPPRPRAVLRGMDLLRPPRPRALRIRAPEANVPLHPLRPPLHGKVPVRDRGLPPVQPRQRTPPVLAGLNAAGCSSGCFPSANDANRAGRRFSSPFALFPPVRDQRPTRAGRPRWRSSAPRLAATRPRRAA